MEKESEYSIKSPTIDRGVLSSLSFSLFFIFAFLSLSYKYSIFFRPGELLRRTLRKDLLLPKRRKPSLTEELLGSYFYPSDERSHSHSSAMHSMPDSHLYCITESTLSF